MLHDGQNLDVRESQLFDVSAQLLRQAPITHETAVLVAPPRSQVDFVNRQWPVMPTRRLLGPLPVVVAPAVPGRASHQAGGAGTEFAGAGVRIRLDQQSPAVCVAQFELVTALADSGNEQLPDALAGMAAHGVTTPVPVIEITNNADPLGIGRPDGEQGPIDARDLVVACSQQLLRVAMMTGMKSVHFSGRQLRPETVGITRVVPTTTLALPEYPVVRWQFTRSTL